MLQELTSQAQKIKNKTTLKKFLIFLEMELLYISGNGNPENFLIFQDVTFKDRKNKESYS